MVRVVRAHRLEVMAATFGSDPDSLRPQVEGWKRHGVRMFVVSGGRSMFSSGYKSIVASLAPLHALALRHRENGRAQGERMT